MIRDLQANLSMISPKLDLLSWFASISPIQAWISMLSTLKCSLQENKILIWLKCQACGWARTHDNSESESQKVDLMCCGFESGCRRLNFGIFYLPMPPLFWMYHSKPFSKSVISCLQDKWGKVVEQCLIVKKSSAVSTLCTAKFRKCKFSEKFFIESYYFKYIWTRLYKSQLFVIWKNCPISLSY